MPDFVDNNVQTDVVVVVVVVVVVFEFSGNVELDSLHLERASPTTDL